MTDATTFSKIRIGIASPDDIRSWSYGEVTKPETINYRTYRPERDGLFCERIFGPVKDWECHCGRYKKVKFKGIFCERCGVEITRSKVRRERMGHIELVTPVCHIWYLKGVPSPLALMLDMSPRALEQVLYLASYIVTHVDLARLDLERITQALQEEEEAIRATPMPLSGAANDEDTDSPELGGQGEEDAPTELGAGERSFRVEGERLLKQIQPRQLLTEDQFRALDDVLDALTCRTGDDYSEIVRAGTGATAIKALLKEIDLQQLAAELRAQVSHTRGAKQERAIKRLEVCEAFIASRARPEWMILDCVPVISPELRPMVQLDGGRFATSDLNDLYRRIINRNNRLKKITEIRAPESIVNHEKRLLQEAVDALIDNGRRTRPVVGSNNRALKSLSDMLKGKEGRFRKNLLGKRVDYSGRSVIVVGPHLKLHQCGLPKEMALELFKPFVMKALCENRPDRPALTQHIKTARRMIERRLPAVWDALEEVIREHPVLLNRAPTLHRLGIQAFEPILVDGKAIQVHPLVCHAFNADFDGDQMAVHVPLSAYAQAEARILMLSSHNLFSPANGAPVVAPTQDIILGAYYLTAVLEHAVPRNGVFCDPQEALLAHDCGQISLHEPIRVRIRSRGEIVGDGAGRQTTAGRLIFNEILPESLRYQDATLFETLTGKRLAALCSEVCAREGNDRLVGFLDDLKALGFRYATQSGMSLSFADLHVPVERDRILQEAETAARRIARQYNRGELLNADRKAATVEQWNRASGRIGDAILDGIDHFNPIYMMIDSGARGSRSQLTQLSGMRGLMAGPSGNLIEDLPIKSCFQEGLNVLEFFVSTHGVRKGMVDMALRTADAGYLTRRLVDAAHDVIVRSEDCGTTTGISVTEIVEEDALVESLEERVRGRTALQAIRDPRSGALLVEANAEIDDAAAKALDGCRVLVDDLYEDPDTGAAPAWNKGDVLLRSEVEALLARGVWRRGATARAAAAREITTSPTVTIRSAVTCGLRRGICAKCYGRDLATGRPVEIGVAVGIVAAQSIGEPGTQLTMRNFHGGGVAGKDVTGAPGGRREETESLRRILSDFRSGSIRGEFDQRERARQAQTLLKLLEAPLTGLPRVVELFEGRDPRGEAVVAELAGDVVEVTQTGLPHIILNERVPLDHSPARLVGREAGAEISYPSGQVIAGAGEIITRRMARQIQEAGLPEVVLRKTILVPHRGKLAVQQGDTIRPGDRLTRGSLPLRQLLKRQGPGALLAYMVREIQAVYKDVGVDIDDRHIEVIVRPMLRKRTLRQPGDTRFLPGQIVDRFVFADENARVEELGRKPATADDLLLGISAASLTSESFLSAASFQKTPQMLTEAAVRGRRDRLAGLKENVLLGRLIPAGTGLPEIARVEPATPDGREIPLDAPLRDDRPARPDPEEDFASWLYNTLEI